MSSNRTVPKPIDPTAAFDSFVQGAAQYHPQHGEDDLTRDSVRAVEEFILHFRASSLSDPTVVQGEKVQGHILAAAVPDIATPLISADRAKLAIEAFRWFRNRFADPFAPVPLWLFRSTGSDEPQGTVSFLEASDPIPPHNLCPLQIKALIFGIMFHPPVSIDGAAAFLEGIIQPSLPTDIASAFRATPEYSDFLLRGTEYTALIICRTALHLHTLLLPTEELSPILAMSEDNITKITAYLRRILPEFSQPQETALIPLHKSLHSVVESWRNACSDLKDIADSSLLQSVQIAAAALHNDPVLLLGSTGTGKDLSAKAIHSMSMRAKHPHVVVNCAAIPADLLESELFGHERGAFSGAVRTKIGLIEEADEGTLFLDEIGLIPLAVQAKLLVALESNRIRRVGAIDDIDVDVRFLFATSRDLPQMISEDTFLPDLYQRMRPDFAIFHPDIGDRSREDVQEIWEHLVRKAESELSKGTRVESEQNKDNPSLHYEVPDDVLDLIIERDWPGNCRQLRYFAKEVVRRRGPYGLQMKHEMIEHGTLQLAIRSRPRECSAIPEHEPIAASAPGVWPSERAITDAVAALANPNADVYSVERLFSLALMEAVVKQEGSVALAAKQLGLKPGTLSKRLQRTRSPDPSS